MGIHTGNIVYIRTKTALSGVDHFVGFALRQGAATDGHIADSTGGEHFVFNKLFIAFAGEFFNDASQQAVTEVGIFVYTTGDCGIIVIQGPADQLAEIIGGLLEHGIIAIIGPGIAGMV